ncbi:MAG TPA: GNAT family N-acetyltransferase [Ornithinicoccus sp.]|nr:GNAT family N-acetyltransferase [Ornithinicoccus sp.]
MGLTWRPIAPDDVAAVAALVNAVAEADGTGEVTTEESLRESLDAPRFQPSTDSVLVWEGDELVGTGFVFGRDDLVDGRALMMVSGGIHPAHRGQGIGAELLTRLETRAVELAGERLPGQPVRLRSSGGLAGSAAQRLLEQRGYRPDNYFVTMQVELADWVDPGTASTAVVPDETQRAATRDAHNDAFRDHRNFSPIPADAWEHWSRSSQLRPGQCQVVMEGDRVLAYVVAGEHEEGVIHVELVGTRREARGRGLGREVLVAGLRTARDAGYRVSELEVDSTSPTGADRLYASVGYRPVRVISRYVRDVT